MRTNITPLSRMQALERQRLLLRKIENAVGEAVTVADMTDVASSMVVLGIMQMHEDKDLALKYLDHTHRKMAEIIDMDFDSYQRDLRASQGLH